MSVFVYFEIAAAVHLYVVLPVDSHHRHLFQHFEYGVALCVLVACHIVAKTVDFGSHKRFLCYYFHFAQYVSCNPGDHSSEVDLLIVAVNLEVLFYFLLAD